MSVEGFDGRLLDLIKETMYTECKICWLSHLAPSIEEYNNRKHGTKKMTPTEISADKKLIYPKNNINNIQIQPPKFQIGGFVWVPDKRNLYSEGYTTNWNREIFKINQLNNTNPLTYTLEDENGEIIQGTYYQQELLKSVFDFTTNR